MVHGAVAVPFNTWLTEFRNPCAGPSKGNWNLTKLMRTFCANNCKNIEIDEMG